MEDDLLDVIAVATTGIVCFFIALEAYAPRAT